MISNILKDILVLHLPNGIAKPVQIVAADNIEVESMEKPRARGVLWNNSL